MRHRLSTRRLPEKPAHARMLKRNLLTSLLLYESVRTTKKRAQTVCPMVDRLIAMAKRTEPRNAIRRINRLVTDRNASRKIMEVYVKRFAAVPSGFTRMTPVGARKGDGAPLVDVVFLEGVGSVVSHGTNEKKAMKAPFSHSSNSSLSS